MLKRLFLLCYAALYDRISGPAERAGLRERRHDLLAQATGATVEIGAGTGLNLPHYPPAVTRLVLIEPDPHMSRRLRRRVSRLGRDAEILDATCEILRVALTAADSGPELDLAVPAIDRGAALGSEAQMAPVLSCATRARLVAERLETQG